MGPDGDVLGQVEEDNVVYDEMVFDDNADMYLDEQICVDDLGVEEVGEFVQVERQGLVPMQRTYTTLDKENAAGDSKSGMVQFGMHQSAMSDMLGPSTSRAQSNSYFATGSNRPSLPSIGQYPPRAKSKKRAVIGSKKPCNCTKSQCLKLYCDCFANGEFCRDCNCKDCHNNMNHESERTVAIKQSLERNPNAFKPKIGPAGARGRVDAATERLHQKGCHCKKSSCLKNYCECYEAKVACTSRCKCNSCRNTEADRFRKEQSQPPARDTKVTPTSLLSLVGNSSEGVPSTSGSYSDEESDGEGQKDPKTLPWFYMTDGVIEAATMCMIAQTDDLMNSTDHPPDDAVLERCVLSEFANCVKQIIESAASPGSGTGSAIPPWEQEPAELMGRKD